MVDAVRTTASPAAIWTICVVAVACLAFWLGMVVVYATRPDPRHRRVTDLSVPVLGGIHMAAGGRSVAPTRDAPAVIEDFGTLGARPAGETGAGPAARPRVPAQRGPAAPAEPIPAQRAAGAGQPTAASADTGAGGQS
jgi:hypothetical protein